MTSSLHHNDVITIEILDVYEILLIRPFLQIIDISDFKKWQINDKNWNKNVIFNTNIK